jgi:alkylhydroperoxidase family enzyme
VQPRRRVIHVSPEHPAAEIALARERSSSDPQRAAAAQFAKQVTETRGKVTDADLASVRDAGYTDPQIIEIVALSVQFLLTNFINNVADTENDFPESEATVA